MKKYYTFWIASVLILIVSAICYITTIKQYITDDSLHYTTSMQQYNANDSLHYITAVKQYNTDYRQSYTNRNEQYNSKDSRLWLNLHLPLFLILLLFMGAIIILYKHYTKLRLKELETEALKTKFELEKQQQDTMCNIEVHKNAIRLEYDKAQFEMEHLKCLYNQLRDQISGKEEVLEEIDRMNKINLKS